MSEAPKQKTFKLWMEKETTLEYLDCRKAMWETLEPYVVFALEEQKKQIRNWLRFRLARVGIGCMKFDDFINEFNEEFGKWQNH